MNNDSKISYYDAEMNRNNANKPFKLFSFQMVAQHPFGPKTSLSLKLKNARILSSRLKVL